MKRLSRAPRILFASFCDSVIGVEPVRADHAAAANGPARARALGLARDNDLNRRASAGLLHRACAGWG